jgi:hypothetical protein
MWPPNTGVVRRLFKDITSTDFIGKGKVRPRTGHEVLEGEKYSSTLCLTSVLDWGWVVNATPRPLYPREIDPISIV